MGLQFRRTEKKRLRREPVAKRCKDGEQDPPGNLSFFWGGSIHRGGEEGRRQRGADDETLGAGRVDSKGLEKSGRKLKKTKRRWARGEKKNRRCMNWIYGLCGQQRAEQDPRERINAGKPKPIA